MRNDFFISILGASIAALSIGQVQALILGAAATVLPPSASEAHDSTDLAQLAAAVDKFYSYRASYGTITGSAPRRRRVKHCNRAVITKIVHNVDQTQHIIPADEFYATPMFMGIGTIDTYNEAMNGDYEALWSLTKREIWKHFQVTWEQTPHFAWPGPELEMYVDWVLNPWDAFYTSPDAMLNAFVQHDCVDVQGLSDFALSDCRSFWIQRITTDYMGWLDAFGQAYVFWLSSDEQCPPTMVRANADYTVNSEPLISSLLQVFDGPTGTLLWKQNPNVDVGIEETGKFCVRVTNWQPLDDSSCVDFTVSWF